MRYLHLLIFILIIDCNDVNEDKFKIVFLGDSIQRLESMIKRLELNIMVS